MCDLYKVPYETLEVNPLTKKEFKAIGSDYRKVPVALFGDTQVLPLAHTMSQRWDAIFQTARRPKRRPIAPTASSTPPPC